MTLEEFLYDLENKKYKSNHRYNLPDKLFQKYLSYIEFIDFKCKTYIQIHFSSEPLLKNIVELSYEIAVGGYWVVEEQDGVLTLFNFVLKRQAEEYLVDKDAYIVWIPKKVNITYSEYSKCLRKKAHRIKQEYLMTYSQDEGCICIYDIMVVLDDNLRGHLDSNKIKNTRLYKNQPKSYEKVLLIIKDLKKRRVFQKLQKYLEGGGRK